MVILVALIAGVYVISEMQKSQTRVAMQKVAKSTASKFGTIFKNNAVSDTVPSDSSGEKNNGAATSDSKSTLDTMTGYVQMGQDIVNFGQSVLSTFGGGEDKPDPSDELE